LTRDPTVQLSKQLDDFPISFAIKARVIFEVTGQSALRKSMARVASAPR
jgi:hypothetical protein